MAKSCCIKNCKSQWIRNGEITFHRFPKDPESYTAFVSGIPPSLTNKITKYSLICSKHFALDCFRSVPSFQNHLKKKAVPTLFDNDLNSSLTCAAPINEEVESTESTSTVNVTLDEETTPDHYLSHAEILQSIPTINIRIVKEVGTQTSEHQLGPSDEVIKLREKIKTLQKRLLRRDIRLKTLNNFVRHLNSKD